MSGEENDMFLLCQTQQRDAEHRPLHQIEGSQHFFRRESLRLALPLLLRQLAQINYR